MRLSSHLYFRTDGTLGLLPVIDVAPDGTILSISECERSQDYVEMAHTQFMCGIIIPALVACGAPQPELGYIHATDLQGENPALSFESKEDFLRKISALTIGRAKACGRFPEIGAIGVQRKPGLLLVENIDLNTFISKQPRLKQLI